MKVKSLLFIAVSIIVTLSLLCGCAGSSNAEPENNKTEDNKTQDNKSESNKNEIDLSTLQWEGGLDEYFEFVVSATDWNAQGPVIVYTQSMKIIQVKSGEISDVEFTLPVSEVAGFTVSCPKTVRMGVNGVAEFQFSVTGSTGGKDTAAPVILTEEITATGTFIPND